MIFTFTGSTSTGQRETSSSKDLLTADISRFPINR